jgi:hypothetical protein
MGGVVDFVGDALGSVGDALGSVGKFVSPFLPAIGGAIGGPLGAAAGTAATMGLNSLFGEDPASVVRGQSPERSLLGFSGGGLTAGFSGGNVNIGASAERNALIDSLRGVFGDRAGEFRRLAGLVEPGFGALTEAGVQSIRDQRRRTVGNLRENLARRRISGSSFAADAITRAEADFAQREAQFRATSFLQELETVSRFIDESFKSDVDRFSTLLTEMNLQGDLGAQFASKGTASLSAANSIQQQLLADIAIQEQQGRGALFSNVGTALSTSLGNLFSGPLSGSGGQSGTVTAPGSTTPLISMGDFAFQ